MKKLFQLFSLSVLLIIAQACKQPPSPPKYFIEPLFSSVVDLNNSGLMITPVENVGLVVKLDDETYRELPVFEEYVFVEDSWRGYIDPPNGTMFLNDFGEVVGSLEVNGPFDMIQAAIEGRFIFPDSTSNTKVVAASNNYIIVDMNWQNGGEEVVVDYNGHIVNELNYSLGECPQDRELFALFGVPYEINDKGVVLIQDECRSDSIIYDIRTGETTVKLFSEFQFFTASSNGLRTLNNKGVIAGSVNYAPALYDYEHDKITVLPKLYPEHPQENFITLNDNGVALGVSRPEAWSWADTTIIYYDSQTGLHDLNDLIVNPIQGVQLNIPEFINNQGVIIARDLLGNHNGMYKLTPVE